MTDRKYTGWALLTLSLIFHVAWFFVPESWSSSVAGAATGLAIGSVVTFLLAARGGKDGRSKS